MDDRGGGGPNSTKQNGNISRGPEENEAQIVDLENSQNMKIDASSLEDVTLDKAAERALLWKIDLALIPYIFFLYVISSLNRNNIGNAKIENLPEDLHLTGQQYVWTASAFYITYAVFETPSNMVLKKVRPSFWFPIIVIAWGSCMTFMGIAKNFTDLLLCRLLLGVGQAGYYPGISYYLSCWYRKREYGVRAAIFFSASILSGTFGGLLAAAIAKMDGVGGLAGWSWIFIVEGLAAVVAGFVSFFMIQDFPDRAKFLTPEERKRTMARLELKKEGPEKVLSLAKLWAATKDCKTLIGMALYMGLAGPLYNFTIFMPSIIRELGFSSNRAQLLSAPPYVVACIATVWAGWFSDRTGHRALCNVIGLATTMTGYAMNVVPSAGVAVRYAGTYLVLSGAYPCVPNTMAWISNNVEGSYKRSIVMAMVFSWGTLNGFVTPHVFRAQDAPKFTLGHSVMMGYVFVSLVSTGAMVAYMRAENGKRERGERDYRVRTGTEEEAAELGDQHPNFRYTY